MEGFRLQIEIIVAILRDFSKSKQIRYCLCQISVDKNRGWRIFWVTTWNLRQIWIWFEDSFKEFRMQIEIIAVIFDLISSNE